MYWSQELNYETCSKDDLIKEIRKQILNADGTIKKLKKHQIPEEVKVAILRCTNKIPEDSSITLNGRITLLYKGEEDPPLCLHCGVNTTNYYKPENRFLVFCSNRCANLASRTQRELSNIEKYGVKNPSCSPEVKKKIKATSLDKYGVSNPAKSQEVKKKISTFHSSNAEVIEKRKATNLERYGSTTPLLNEEVKQKIKDSLRARWGVNAPLQSPEIQQKRKMTTKDRYGVEHYTQKHLSQNALLLREELSIDSIPSKEELELSTSQYYKVLKKAGVAFESQSSMAEKEIATFLRGQGVKVETNNRTILGGAEIDIYLPELKIAVEFNGTYFHTEKFGRHKTYHLEKTKKANSLGIEMIHIFSNIYDLRRDIVFSRLLSKIGKTKRIYARKTEVRELSAKDSKVFFDQNHLQGNVASSFALGLYHQDELVAAMSFSKARYTKKAAWELLRFANLSGTSVVGGASKLLKHFRDLRNGAIVSYADRTWSNGNLYNQLGFTLVSENAPAPFYTKDHRTFYNRLSLQKHKLTYLSEYDESLTAVQIVKNAKFDTIWDCGTLTYILN